MPNIATAHGDFLYSHITPYCNASLDYSGAPSVTNLDGRLFMTSLYALSVIAVLAMPRRREEPSAAGMPDGYDSQRWVMLDMVRTACVACVVTEHSGGTVFSETNTGFVTKWVLQFLFVTSGIAFMSSRRSLHEYLLRYCLLLCAGLVCNVVGDSIARPGWPGDFGNTVFQNWYVVFLMLLAVCAAPMRAVLRHEADPFGGGAVSGGLPDRTMALLIYSSLFGASFCAYLIAGDIQPIGSILGKSSFSLYVKHLAGAFLHYVAHSFGFGALVALHVFLRRRPDGGLTWLLLGYIYVPVIVFPQVFAYGPHMVLLYLLGAVGKVYPFAYSTRIVHAIKSYWPLYFCMYLLLCNMPTLTGRCDIYPPLFAWERFRWYSGEAALQILLLTRALDASDPYDVCGALSWWALFAFCTHLMLARTLPVPYGALIEYATIPIFLLAFKWPGSPLYRSRRPHTAEIEAASFEPILPSMSTGGESTCRTRGRGEYLGGAQLDSYGTFGRLVGRG